MECLALEEKMPGSTLFFTLRYFRLRMIFLKINLP